MKLTLLAVALAAFAASTVYANEEQNTGATTETAKPVKTEAKKPVKKHNHMEEKTGIPMNAPKAQGEAHNDAHEGKAPTKKHFHPTDR